jgi:hypothetical protein
MGGAMQSLFNCVTVGGDVRLDGKAGFVSGDVEGDDARASEVPHKLYRLEALRGVEVAEGAEDEAGLDAGGADALLGGSIDEGDDSFGCESLRGVQQGSEAEFGVEDVVSTELIKKIFNDDAEGVFGLHELESAGSASEEVGEAGALRWRDEFVLVFFASDLGRETGDGGVAEGAVEMEVELDFGEGWHECEILLL